MSQYLRYAQVTAKGFSFTYGGSEQESGLRIRFQITATPLITPNPATILITNANSGDAQNALQPEGTTITLDAGYNDSHGVIYTGQLKQAIYGRESPTDTLLTLYAGDNHTAHNYATVSTTLPPGSTPQQHLNVALQAMQPFGTSLGYIGVDLSKPTYPRAVTLFGMARDVLINIAKSKNAVVGYQQGKITMVPQGGSLPGGPVVLNSSSGLVGMPSQTTEGIMARCLINPQIQANTQVQIDQKDIQGGIAQLQVGASNAITSAQLAHVAADGLYTVYKVDVSGDTRENDWYMDLAMIASSGETSITANQAATSYGTAVNLGPES